MGLLSDIFQTKRILLIVSFSASLALNFNLEKYLIRFFKLRAAMKKDLCFKPGWPKKVISKFF